jgi:hypothetical protein
MKKGVLKNRKTAFESATLPTRRDTLPGCATSRNQKSKSKKD